MEKKSFILKVRKVTIVTLMVLLIASCTFFKNRTVRIPKALVQSKISKKFPVTRNFLLASMTLKNPKVSFKEEKMYIETDYEAEFLSDKNKGKMYLSSGIRYDSEKEEMYLVDLSIDKITDEAGKETADTKAGKTIKSLITNYVEMHPVYSPKEDDDDKKDKKKVKIKNIYIKKGKLYIQT